VIAEGRRRAIRAAVILAFGPALLLAICLLGLGGSMAVGASPSPAQPAEPATTAQPTASPGIIGTGDPRSNGQGPGLVGSPFAIALGVVLLGVLSAGGTLLYLRLTRDE
jgi:hypothetical protein